MRMIKCEIMILHMPCMIFVLDSALETSLSHSHEQEYMIHQLLVILYKAFCPVVARNKVRVIILMDLLSRECSKTELGGKVINK